MQTTVESTETHTVKVTVEIPPDEYSSELDATYRSIANQVRIPVAEGRDPIETALRALEALSG